MLYLMNKHTFHLSLQAKKACSTFITQPKTETKNKIHRNTIKMLISKTTKLTKCINLENYDNSKMPVLLRWSSVLVDNNYIWNKCNKVWTKLTFTAAIATSPWTSLYIFGGVSTTPLLRSTSTAVPYVPEIASLVVFYFKSSSMSSNSVYKALQTR